LKPDILLSLIGLAPSLLAWVGLFGLCRELAAKGHVGTDRRLSFILACVVWGALLSGITESLSLGRHLTAPGACIAWTGLDLALGCVWLRFAGGTTAILGTLRVELGHLQSMLRLPSSWTLPDRLMLAAVALTSLPLGAIALLTPSTNWDSLTYHLPRVMHWIQNRSVEHYPTGCISQLQMGPWTAFLQTHLMLFWGDDRLANLVQWFAMIGCVLAASFIAKRLTTGGDSTSTRAQLFAALLVVTLPTGILESITTQTDYVAAFWLASFVALILALWDNAYNRWYLGGAALAVGLGLATKITALFYLAPAGIAAGAWLTWRWKKLPSILGRVALVFTLICLPVLPHAWRNHALFGSTVSSQSTTQSAGNAQKSLGVALSNVLRNAALHTNTGIRPLTRLANATLAGLHGLLSRQLNDPGSTFPEGSFRFQEDFFVSDSSMGNPYHLGLILLALLAAFFRPRSNAVALGYAALLLASFLMICWVLRWQQWNARYQLPGFVLLMPAVAVILIRLWPRWSVLAASVVVTAFGGVIIACNQSRPIFDPKFRVQSRTEQMLTLYVPWLHDQVEAMARDVVASRCHRVGLKFGADDGEYLVWALLRKHGFEGRIDHVDVENESGRIGQAVPQPCVVISMSSRPPSAKVVAEFPHRLDYGAVSAFWSEPGSHWSELVQFDSKSRTLRSIPRVAGSIPLDGFQLDLYFRAPRSGTLELRGKLVDDRGSAAGRIGLRVSNEAGNKQQLELDPKEQPFQMQAPVSSGTTRIQITALDASARAAGRIRLANLEWQFDPQQER